MKIHVDSIITRAKTTRHAQEDLKSSKTWNEKTLDQWDNDIADLQKTQQVYSTAEFTRNSTRAALDAALQELHRRTMQCLSLAKFHFRDEPSKLEALNRLTSNGAARRDIAREALALETAWQETDPAWAPSAENTFAAFQALRKQCSDLDAAFIAAYSTWRTQSEILNRKAAAMNDANVAWYAAAIRIFPAGTAEGDMIRRSIPTHYSPPAKDQPPSAAPQPATASAAAPAEAQ
jgi:hypothetical protein